MVSITPAFANSKRTSQKPRHTMAWLMLLCGLFYAGHSHADGIVINDARTQLADQVYYLDADIDYTMSSEAIEALDNGIPLTFNINIEVQRKRNWWLPDADIASLEQRFQVLFHALSDQYLVINLNSGTFHAYHSRYAAFHSMGEMRDFPLLDSQLVEMGEDYEIEIRTELDIESLPSPLRPVAYLTPAWRLKSDWYTCSLTP